MWIDRIDGAKRSQRRRRASRNIAKVAILKLRLGYKRRHVELRKNQVTLNLVVVHAKPAADRCLGVSERRISETESRRHSVRRLIKTTWRSGRNLRQSGRRCPDTS